MKKLLLFCFVLSTAGCHLLDEECGAKCGTGTGHFHPYELGGSDYNLINLGTYSAPKWYYPTNLSDIGPTFVEVDNIPIRICYTITGDSTAIERDTAAPHTDIIIYPNMELCKISRNY